MAKLAGRDLNGMRAANWSQPDLTAIQSIKVDAKCTNAQLLDAIKQIVSYSVVALRGNNTDDKYRNIVDMLMLRVRGALSNAVDEIQSGQQTIDNDALVKSISSTVIECIESKIDPKDGLLVIDQSNLQSLIDAIVSAISTQIDKQTNADKAQKTEQPPKTSIDATKEEPTRTITIESTSTPQSISVDDLKKLQVEIDKNFKKIEQLIMSAQTTKVVKVVESKSSIGNVDETIVKAAQKTQAQVAQPTDKLVKKAQQAQTQIAQSTDKLAKKTSAPKSTSSSKVMTNKQFIALTKLITNGMKQVNATMTTAIESTQKRLEDISNVLETIYKHVTQKKLSLLGILAVISLFLIPMFWDKIKSFLSTINEKFDITGKISSFINSIDWQKYVGMAIDGIWEATKAAFMTLCANPLDFVKQKFEKSYTAITTWSSDIWGWVQEKVGFSKKKQEENEKTAEEKSTNLFKSLMSKLEGNTASNIVNLQNQTNEACNATTTNMNAASEEVSGKIEEMQQQSNDAITSTTEKIQENNDEVNNIILPGMDQELHESIDGAASKVEQKSDLAIVASENKLNSALDDLDKKIEENGAPTSVSKETLAKMDAEGEGSNISKGGIDQKVSMPKTVVQTTTEEQGKTIQLYAKSADVDRASKESAEISNLLGNTTQPGNVTVNQGDVVTNQNIQGKILINTSGNPAEKEATLYENMHTAVTEVSKNSATIEEGLNKNSKLIDSLKEKVGDYFDELNGLVKLIQKKPPSQKNNTLIINSNRDDQHNSAQMNEF